MAEAKIYYQSDCNLSLLDGKTIAIIGYGIQGPGQACTLRDNGFNVIVGQRQGKTYEFDIEKFCVTYKYFPTKVDAALLMY